jgi:hypothetical protein
VQSQQIPAPNASSGASPSSIEEVIVRGRQRSQLLDQIQLAREAIYSRFNEINSTDDFDVRCRDVARTGSKIARRVCSPNYWSEAEARAARQVLRGMQDSTAEPWTLIMNETVPMAQRMADEMRRLAIEDDDFRSASARLAVLEAQLEEETRSDSESSRSAAYIATASEQVLPYDARVMADVLIGRDSWEHTLTNPTFAIAHLLGEVESIRVRCGRNRARFDYEFDAEWTLPEDWEQCRLTIDAPRGTSFTLFEFD